MSTSPAGYVCAPLLVAIVAACGSTTKPAQPTTVVEDDVDVVVPWEEDPARKPPASAQPKRGATRAAEPQRRKAESARDSVGVDTTGLGPAVDVPDFGIRFRPPAGYDVLEEERGPYGFRMFMWRPPRRRPDDTSPWIMIEVVPPPEGETELIPPDLYLASRLRGIRKRRSTWTSTAPTTVTIDGVAFRMSRWRGVSAERDVRMFGFVMVAQGPGYMIGISSQDMVPYHRATLPLAEASARTLRFSQ